MRRQFNLGNVELTPEITQTLLQEQQGEIMNPSELENTIGEQDDYLFIQGNLQTIPGEDNHDEIDLYD